MIYVGIDVAKDKHDCFAMSSDGEIHYKLIFTEKVKALERLKQIS